tara:strand:- start:41 stop:409 length:369 start_codon:yes stop_codon:yes gene_type:complete
VNFPDIEIYIKNLRVKEINIWLDKLFEVGLMSQIGSATLVHLRDSESEIECRIIENAADPNFTSIYFSPNKTKWETDLDCAKDAFSHFQLEVRCATSGWSENSQEEEDWFKINSEGTHRIKW